LGNVSNATYANRTGHGNFLLNLAAAQPADPFCTNSRDNKNHPDEQQPGTTALMTCNHQKSDIYEANNRAIQVPAVSNATYTSRTGHAK
jgi:hypothetical protein